MPDKCNYCIATNRIIVDADRKVRWCSLRPMPKKKEKYSLMGDNSAGRVDGWNACIDEILGGVE